MRKSTLFKIVGLLVLSGLTFTVTSFMMRAMAVTATDQEEDTVTTETLTAPIKTPQGRQVAVKILAMHAARSFSVTGFGNEVNVSAQVDIMDRRENVAFMWTLRVINEFTKEVVLDRPYKDQVFSVVPGEQLSPTFDETLNLVPGKYRVELDLEGMRGDSKIEMLKTGKAVNPHKLVSFSKTIDF